VAVGGGRAPDARAHGRRTCEMHVFPQPKAPGMAHVPPSTEGKSTSSTRWPVMSASLPGSFSPTGRGLRTGPLVRHGHVDAAARLVVADLDQGLVDVVLLVVVSAAVVHLRGGGGGGTGRGWRDADARPVPAAHLDDLAKDPRGHHDLVVLHELVLIHLPDDAAADQGLALPDAVGAVPVLLLTARVGPETVRGHALGTLHKHAYYARVKGGDIYTKGHERRLAGFVKDDLERSLDSVKDVLHDSRA